MTELSDRWLADLVGRIKLGNKLAERELIYDSPIHDILKGIAEKRVSISEHHYPPEFLFEEAKTAVIRRIKAGCIAGRLPEGLDFISKIALEAINRTAYAYIYYIYDDNYLTEVRESIDEREGHAGERYSPAETKAVGLSRERLIELLDGVRGGDKKAQRSLIRHWQIHNLLRDTERQQIGGRGPQGITMLYDAGRRAVLENIVAGDFDSQSAEVVPRFLCFAGKIIVETMSSE